MNTAIRIKYKQDIHHEKIHEYLLELGYAKPDSKKKKDASRNILSLGEVDNATDHFY